MGLVGVANRNDEPTPRVYKPAKPKIPDVLKDDSEVVEHEHVEESEQATEGNIVYANRWYVQPPSHISML